MDKIKFVSFREALIPEGLAFIVAKVELTKGKGATRAIGHKYKDLSHPTYLVAVSRP